MCERERAAEAGDSAGLGAVAEAVAELVGWAALI